MTYEEFLEAYVPELRLIDALDELKHYSVDAAKTIDHWASHSNNEQSDE
jgi:hypothetical protein